MDPLVAAMILHGVRFAYINEQMRLVHRNGWTLYHNGYGWQRGIHIALLPDGITDIAWEEFGAISVRDADIIFSFLEQ